MARYPTLPFVINSDSIEDAYSTVRNWASALVNDLDTRDVQVDTKPSTNIYTVKTVKYSDNEWTAQGSVLNTLGGNYARTTGRIHITSEMVRAAVASNQLLRPWDNVPRTAKAQDIVGNRIVYANYLQNYNL